MEHRHRLLSHPIRELALGDQLSDLGKGSFVVMWVGVGLFAMVMVVRQMHLELYPFEVQLASARHAQVIAAKVQLLQLLLQLAGLDPQVNQGGDEHVAADAAEQVEVKGLHAIRRPGR